MVHGGEWCRGGRKSNISDCFSNHSWMCKISFYHCFAFQQSLKNYNENTTNNLYCMLKKCILLNNEHFWTFYTQNFCNFCIFTSIRLLDKTFFRNIYLIFQCAFCYVTLQWMSWRRVQLKKMSRWDLSVISSNCHMPAFLM